MPGAGGSWTSWPAASTQRPSSGNRNWTWDDATGLAQRRCRVGQLGGQLRWRRRTPVRNPIATTAPTKAGEGSRANRDTAPSIPQPATPASRDGFLGGDSAGDAAGVGERSWRPGWPLRRPPRRWSAGWRWSPPRASCAGRRAGARRPRRSEACRVGERVVGEQVRQAGGAGKGVDGLPGAAGGRRFRRPAQGDLGKTGDGQRGRRARPGPAPAARATPPRAGAVTPRSPPPARWTRADVWPAPPITATITTAAANSTNDSQGVVARSPLRVVPDQHQGGRDHGHHGDWSREGSQGACCPPRRRRRWSGALDRGPASHTVPSP